jgi:anti-sigma factor RsiW
MTGLTHEQARRYLHAGADNCLSPAQQTALDSHLTDCSACRKYADELGWLHVAIARALHSRWSSPPRQAPSPVEMVARVRHRMWFDAERRFFLTFANALVRLGSLAVVAIMVIGLVRGNLTHTTQSSPVNASQTGGGLINRLPSFELEAENVTSAGHVAYVSSAAGEQWLLPAFPFSRLRMSRY